MPAVLLILVKGILGGIWKGAMRDIDENGLIIGANRKRVLKEYFPTREEREARENVRGTFKALATQIGKKKS